MSAPAITLESVGKHYHLGVGHGAEGKIAQKLEQTVRTPLRRLFGRPQPEATVEEFWALKDISLEIEPGGVVGVIGRNGAGKSTMLKLLAQIVLPTEGRIKVRGRVGTLLEVGTGFHPELTGRENIFLNGAILGMSRDEINRSFHEIVEFSGIAPQFLDTPVKRYSSGMHVRLGFSVAAHLRPEILLVDEVLAVGDQEFQRKCLGRMDEIAQAGRTVVLVTHHLASIERLTERCIWLDGGRVVEDGPTGRVVADYLKRTGATQSGGVANIRPETQREGTGEARLTRLEMRNAAGELTDHIEMGEPTVYAMTFEISEPINEGVTELGICTADGTRFATALSTDDGTPPLQLEPGVTEVKVEVDLTLIPGEYWIDVGIHDFDRTITDYIERVLNFACVNIGYGQTPNYPWPSTQGRGHVRIPSRWSASASRDVTQVLDAPGLDQALGVRRSDSPAGVKPQVQPRRRP